MTQTKRKGNQVDWQETSAKIQAPKSKKVRNSNKNQKKNEKNLEGLLFWALEFGTWKLFVIWCLELGI